MNVVVFNPAEKGLVVARSSTRSDGARVRTQFRPLTAIGMTRWDAGLVGVVAVALATSRTKMRLFARLKSA